MCFLFCCCIFSVFLFSTINQFNSNLAAREPDSKWYAVEIIDKNSIGLRNKQCAYMYIGAGRDVWSGLGVTMLVGNGVGQSLWVNSTFLCVNKILPHYGEYSALYSRRKSTASTVLEFGLALHGNLRFVTMSNRIPLESYAFKSSSSSSSSSRVFI